MRLLSWILFIAIVILEGTLTTLPLTLLFLLCLTVMKRQQWIFALALIAGLFLDIFSFRTIGISSLFLVSFIFLVLLYQRKYETSTLPFVVIASLLGSFFYLEVIGSSAVLMQAILIAFMSFVVFSVYMMLNKPAQRNDGFQKV